MKTFKEHISESKEPQFLSFNKYPTRDYQFIVEIIFKDSPNFLYTYILDDPAKDNFISANIKHKPGKVVNFIKDNSIETIKKDLTTKTVEKLK